MLRKVVLTFESSHKTLKCKFSVTHFSYPNTLTSFFSQLIPHIDRKKAVNKASAVVVMRYYKEVQSLESESVKAEPLK